MHFTPSGISDADDQIWDGAGAGASRRAGPPASGLTCVPQLPRHPYPTTTLTAQGL